MADAVQERFVLLEESVDRGGRVDVGGVLRSDLELVLAGDHGQREVERRSRQRDGHGSEAHTLEGDEGWWRGVVRKKNVEERRVESSALGLQGVHEPTK